MGVREQQQSYCFLFVSVDCEMRIFQKQRAPEAVGSGRANVTLHLLPCAVRVENASEISSIPAIQGRRLTPDGLARPCPINRAAPITAFDVCYAPVPEYMAFGPE
jgi:hypothetical protein